MVREAGFYVIPSPCYTPFVKGPHLRTTPTISGKRKRTIIKRKTTVWYARRAIESFVICFFIVQLFDGRKRAHCAAATP